VGVISRGYGRPGHEVHEVTANSSPQDAGDEALLIARRCQVPVVVGADRPAAGRWLLQRHPETDVILSDDGLQHLALQHDLALCVFDERGLGNGWMFPAGPLREPWPRPHRVPQWLLYSVPEATLANRRPDGQAFVLERRLAEFAYNAAGEKRSLSHWQSHACHALAAIAKPEAFFNMLKQQGLQLKATLALPDHDPLANLPASLGDGSDWLCTEKDASKLWKAHPQAWAVPLEVALPAEFLAELEAALEAKLSSSHGHKTA
jgi:tetraacyldisaccharide 4'-kinase